MEDGADAQEETPEDGPQLRDQVKLHHFTQMGVVARGMGLELEEKERVRTWKGSAKGRTYVFYPQNGVGSASEHIFVDNRQRKGACSGMRGRCWEDTEFTAGS